MNDIIKVSLGYNDFVATAKRTFEEFKAVQNSCSEVIIHEAGEVAHDEESECFIRNTNAKYFGKSDDTLLGDFAELKNGNGSFIRIDLKYAYDNLDSWGEVEDYVTDQIDYSDRISRDAFVVMDMLKSYESIKDRLIIRLLNFSNNTVLLDGMVFKVVGDIAQVLYAVVLDDKETGALNTIKIPRKIFDEWGVDEDEVFRQTMINTFATNCPRLYENILNIENTSDEDSAFMSYFYSKSSLNRNTIPLVTTTRKTNGATALFYPGVKGKIAELYGSSFYVAFTSIHEAMLHCEGTIDPLSIRRHVRATNKTFGPADTLSDEVWYYNKETKEFAPVNI